MNNKPVHIEPCPWCGSSEFDARCLAAEYATVEPTDIDGALCVNLDGYGWYWVHCEVCHSNGPKYHGGENFDYGNTGPKDYRRDRDKTAKAIETAIKAWNTRTPQMKLDLGE